MQTVSILVADDHAVVRRGLRALLETQPSWHVVSEAGNGREAVEKAASLRPQVVILDIGMPKLNGLDAAALIYKANPKTRILMLTMHAAEALIEQTLNAGASGYVLKSDAERDLIAAVDALLHNKTFFTSAASAVILDHLRQGNPRKDARTSGDRLSVREREVVQLLAEGKSNKEIGAALNISKRTVDHHRARIMEKLKVQSVGELVLYAVRNKIVEP
ncbi:MAG: response regulator transcription factor [Candidatus Sulfotelmatobacter sp.]